MIVPSLDSLPETARLSSADVAALSATRAARWRPGLPDAVHSEVFASARDASGTGLALALALDTLEARRAAQSDHPSAEKEDRRAILWVQDKSAVRLTGRPYRPGLPEALQGRMIHVYAENAQDALFALEEGVRCRDLACVIGEVSGNPRALDFTASRRLSLTAERHGVPLWLVRIDAGRDLSSARLRWAVRSAPSAPPRWNAQAPGDAAWAAELFRARTHAPGEWTLTQRGGALVADPKQRQPATVGMRLGKMSAKFPIAGPSSLSVRPEPVEGPLFSSGGPLEGSAALRQAQGERG